MSGIELLCMINSVAIFALWMSIKDIEETLRLNDIKKPD